MQQLVQNLKQVEKQPQGTVSLEELVGRLQEAPKIKDSKNNEIDNPKFDKEKFVDTLFSLATLKTEGFENYRGIKEFKGFNETIEALTRIALDKNYENIKIKAQVVKTNEKGEKVEEKNPKFIEISFIGYIKDILFNILGKIAGQHKLANDTEELILKHLDSEKSFEDNLILLAAIAKKNTFSKKDQDLFLKIISDKELKKEDNLKQAAYSALGFSIFYNIESKDFGLSYLQNEVSKIIADQKDYPEQLEKVVRLVSEVSKLSFEQEKPDMHLVKSSIGLELSRLLSNKSNGKNEYDLLVMGIGAAGINQETFKEIKKNLKNSVDYVKTNECKLSEEEKSDLLKSFKTLIDVIEKQFIPKLPAPRPAKPGDDLASLQ